jgi:hypothetical protein
MTGEGLWGGKMDRGGVVWPVLPLVVLLWALWEEGWCRRKAEATKGPKGRRQLRPRTPKSCAQCGLEEHPAVEECGEVRQRVHEGRRSR